IFCAAIGAASGPELVAAVSNAGGCGILGTASLPAHPRSSAGNARDGPEWKAARRGHGVGTMQTGGATVEIPAYTGYLAEPNVRGDIKQMALYAGQSWSLVNAVKPASEIVAEIVRDADDTVTR